MSVRGYLFLAIPLIGLFAAEDPVYRIVNVESFEGKRGPSAGWLLSYRATPQRSHGYAVATNLEPTPAGGPTYLSVLFRAPPASGVRIRPPKPIGIPSVVREIRFFAYGFARADELYMDLAFGEGRTTRIFCGRLEFRGWRQMRVPLPPGQQGRAFRLNEGGDGIRLVGFFLRLRSDSGVLTEARVYLDHVEALVRPPFRAPKPRWDR